MSRAIICKRLAAIMFLGSSLTSIALAESLSDSVAISCNGSAESKYKKEVERSWPTRVYILDEKRNTIAYWNPEKEEAIPACDTSWQSCSIKFGPKLIEAEGNLNQHFGFYMTIDRRSGFLDYRSSSSPDSKWNFAGTCETTEMPTANTDHNRF